MQIIQNRDIKQPSETKLFISSNVGKGDNFQEVITNKPSTLLGNPIIVNERTSTKPNYFPIGYDKGIYFDGTDDYLTIPGNDNDFRFDYSGDYAGDFCIESWVYKITDGRIFAFQGSLIQLCTNRIEMDFSDMSYIESAISITSNAWTHLACYRINSNYYYSINGIVTFMYSNTKNTRMDKFSNPLIIGAYKDTSAGGFIKGFLQNLRISKGTARYGISNFTPPTLNSNYEIDNYTKLYVKGHNSSINTTSFTDNSTYNKTITTYSYPKIGNTRGSNCIYFDGVDDALLYKDVTNLDLRNTDATIDFWYYVGTSTPSSKSIIDHFSTWGTTVSFYVGHKATSGLFYFVSNSPTYSVLESNVTPTLNTWYHIAMIATSSGLKCYINGNLVGTCGTGYISHYNSNSWFKLFTFADGGSEFPNGCISNLRISKGITRWTNNFTPPEIEYQKDNYDVFLLKANENNIRDISNTSSSTAITVYGDTKIANDRTPVKPNYFPIGYDKGIYFDGTGDYLSTSTNSDFNFNLGTIDVWVNLQASPSTRCQIIGKLTNGAWADLEFTLCINNARQVMFQESANGSTGCTMLTSELVQLNTWTHIAVVIESQNLRKIYVNGILATNGTNTSNLIMLNGSAAVKIGSGYANDFKGFIQNLRLSKGIARWTSNFTPPAMNSNYEVDEFTKLYIKGYDLPVNTKTFIDNSGTPKAITTYGDTKVGYSRGENCIYFDGTGDYLNYNSNELSMPSDINFTIDFWIYPNGNNGMIFDCRKSGDSLSCLNAYIDTSNEFQTDINNTAITIASPTIDLAKWNHIAMVKTSNSLKIYKEGYLIKDLPDTSNRSNITNLYIGKRFEYNTSNYYFNGYLQNLRISKGIARWTSNFTPSEKIYTPDSYDSLILKVDANEFNTTKAITTLGKIQTTSLSRNGKSSISFDGASGYMSIPFPLGFYSTNEDFTWDFWFYLNSNANAIYNPFATIIPGTDSKTRIYIRPQGTNRYIDGSYMSSTIPSTSVNAFNINEWHHVALIRASNLIRIYLDGITQSGVTLNTADTTTLLYIGKYYQGGYIYSGYISDFRFVKGKSLWTSNFTPPKRSGSF